MHSALRRSLVIAHLVTSVGWAGAVLAFFAIAVVGLGAPTSLAAGIYAALDTLIWWVIVPLALTSAISGVVQSLTTPWGLIRHWWLVVKLVITIGATGLLLLHARIADTVATTALTGSVLAGGGQGLRLQLAAQAGAAFAVLVLLTALSVIKPRGTTPLALRRNPVSASSRP